MEKTTKRTSKGPPGGRLARILIDGWSGSQGLEGEGFFRLETPPKFELADRAIGGGEMERRKEERLPVCHQAEDDSGANRFPYRIVNVSKSGCTVASQRELWSDQADVVLNLPLPGRADRLRVKARVVWEGSERNREEEPVLYGLQFVEVDKGSQLILDLYLDYLRRELHLARLDEAWKKLKLAHEKINLLLAWEERKASPYLH